MVYELEEFCNDCREAIQSDPGDGGREMICDKLEIRPTDKVLDIGCGW